MVADTDPGLTGRSCSRAQALEPVQRRLQNASTDRGSQFAVDPTAMEPERAWLATQSPQRSHARETVGADGEFHFDVPIALPLLGIIVHCEGRLKPVEMLGMR
jgi:hypothetical protein